nr:unnamed protein product [Digitaria exilis]
MTGPKASPSQLRVLSRWRHLPRCTSLAHLEHLLHRANVVVVADVLAEAEARHRGEHGGVDCVADPDDGVAGGGGGDVGDEGIHGVPLEGNQELGDAGRVEDVHGEVAADRAPERAVWRAGDAGGFGVAGVEVDAEWEQGVVREGVGVVEDEAPGDVRVSNYNRWPCCPGSVA